MDRDKIDLNRLCAVTKFLFPPVVFISLKVHGFMILLFFEDIRFVELTRLVLYIFILAFTCRNYCFQLLK